MPFTVEDLICARRLSDPRSGDIYVGTQARDVRAHDDVLDRLDRSLLEAQHHLHDLIGEAIKRRYKDRPLFFMDLVENPRTMAVQELNDLMRQAVRDGRLTHAEASRVMWTDIAIRGGNPEMPVYLLVEVSRTVTQLDVELAVKRASILRKAGYDARGAVAGQNIRWSALELADRLGVGRMFECEFDGEDPIVDDERER